MSFEKLLFYFPFVAMRSIETSEEEKDQLFLRILFTKEMNDSNPSESNILKLI